MKRFLSVFVGIYFGMCLAAWGADVQFAWNPPAIAGTAGFYLYFGTQSRSYTEIVDVGAASSFTLRGLQENVAYYFTLSGYGKGGISTFSNEVIVMADSSGRVLTLTPTEDRQTQTGWWYSPSTNGAGISIEVVRGVLFMAWYSYEPDTGRSIWLTSGGAITDPFHYDGDLLSWQAYVPGENPDVPVAEVAGTISIEFLSNNEANIVYDLGTASSEFRIVRLYNNDTTPLPAAPNITGWWYDPTAEGRGAFVEKTGPTVSLAIYNYRDDLSPVWWSSSGAIDPDTMSYQGDLMEWYGGPCFECSVPSQSEPVPWIVGSVSIEFLSDREAYLFLDNTEIHLQRLLPMILPLE